MSTERTLREALRGLLADAMELRELIAREVPGEGGEPLRDAASALVDAIDRALRVLEAARV